MVFERNVTRRSIVTVFVCVVLLAGQSLYALDTTWQDSAQGLADTGRNTIYSLVLRVNTSGNVISHEAPGNAKQHSWRTFAYYDPFSMGDITLSGVPSVTSVNISGGYSALISR